MSSATLRSRLGFRFGFCYSGLAVALIFVLVLSGCGAPATNQISIVGAKLNDGTGKPVIEYSVVVVGDGKVKAAGRQQDVPVPKEGEIVGGLGSSLEALDGGTIEAGKAANLKISGAVNRTMRNGEWVK